MYNSLYPTGTLNVYIQDTRTGDMDLAWSLDRGLANDWLTGQFSYVKQFGRLYRVVFEGVRGNRVADMALDDIKIRNGSECTLLPLEAMPFETTTSISTTPTVSTTTISSNSPSPFDCDFEQGLCTWYDDLTADFNWTRTKASHGSHTQCTLVFHTLLP
jgi:hypothetical protein